MAFVSMHAYDADVWVPQFRGLNQADIGLNPDLRFAAVAENVETINGVLQPQAANTFLTNGNAPSAWETNRVETLAVFHRRWYSGEGSKDWYVCCAGGKFYHKQANAPDMGWEEIPMPEDFESDHFECSLWSWVTYETNDNNGTIDVLIVSNAKDGMFMIIPPDHYAQWSDIDDYDWDHYSSDTWFDVRDAAQWEIAPVDTRADPTDDDEPQKKFGVIERYGERIWGTAVEDEPDTLYYSRAYAADDWSASGPDEDPSVGGGEIKQPSWDGDQFYALKRFGDQLLAFKKNKIWRVLGLSPGEYTFHEQYGKGTEYFSTIAVNGERVFMAGREGALVYDGMDTTPYAKEQINQIWKTVNTEVLDQMCAAMFEQRYYLAFPVGESTVNNAVLVYDMKEGTILYYPGTQIESFLPADDKLYATSSSLPGKILQINRDSWALSSASGKATRWVTPWIDFGYKRIQKGGFDFYFLPEVKENPVTFTVSIQTEKKLKAKQYTCQPLSSAQLALGKEHRVKRMHFGGSGRKFRIIIETEAGVTDPWRLIGGIQIVAETDPD